MKVFQAVSPAVNEIPGAKVIENKFRINKREKKNKLKGKNFQFRKSAQSVPEVNY